MCGIKEIYMLMFPMSIIYILVVGVCLQGLFNYSVSILFFPSYNSSKIMSSRLLIFERGQVVVRRIPLAASEGIQQVVSWGGPHLNYITSAVGAFPLLGQC